MGLIVRNATENDFEAVHFFSVENFRLHLKAQPENFQQADPLSKNSYEVSLTDGSIVLIADLDGHPVGAASACPVKRVNPHPSIRRRHLFQLLDIFVAEDHRRQGIGKALYHEMMRRVKIEGAEGLVFNVWAFNENARKFYEHIGAKCVARRYEDHGCPS